MNNIIIRRPTATDLPQIDDFFTRMVTATFSANEIDGDNDEIEEEIEAKKSLIRMDIDSGGVDRFFLVAVVDGKIIATTSIGRSNDALNECAGDATVDIMEIGSLLVQTEYQKHGVAQLLMIELLKVLKERGAEQFCFDCGYEIAQGIWQKKFGKPTYFVQDFWGEGGHHMVWVLDIDEQLERIRNL